MYIKLIVTVSAASKCITVQRRTVCLLPTVYVVLWIFIRLISVRLYDKPENTSDCIELRPYAHNVSGPLTNRPALQV